MIEQQAQNLLNEFSTELQATRRDLEATCWEFEIQLAAVEAQMIHGGGNVGTRADRVKPLKFDEFMSWTVLHHKFEAVTSHNEWTSCENATHLLTILHGQASNILCSVPVGATCEEIVGALKGHLETTSWQQHAGFNSRP
jgi:hypothetical protein